MPPVSWAYGTSCPSTTEPFHFSPARPRSSKITSLESLRTQSSTSCSPARIWLLSGLERRGERHQKHRPSKLSGCACDVAVYASECPLRKRECEKGRRRGCHEGQKKRGPSKWQRDQGR